MPDYEFHDLMMRILCELQFSSGKILKSNRTYTLNSTERNDTAWFNFYHNAFQIWFLNIFDFYTTRKTDKTQCNIIFVEKHILILIAE